MKKGRWVPLLAGVISLLLIAGIASASQASHRVQRSLAGPFCISKKSGVVRQVAPNAKCRKGEIRKVGFAVTGLPDQPVRPARRVPVAPAAPRVRAVLRA